MFSNNHLFLKFKKFIYNTNTNLRAILMVSIPKIIVVFLTCLSSLKFQICIFEEIILLYIILVPETFHGDQFTTQRWF